MMMTRRDEPSAGSKEARKEETDKEEIADVEIEPSPSQTPHIIEDEQQTEKETQLVEKGKKEMMMDNAKPDTSKIEHRYKIRRTNETGNKTGSETESRTGSKTDSETKNKTENETKRKTESESAKGSESKGERDRGTEREEHITTDMGESEEELMPGTALLAEAFGGAFKRKYTARKRKRKENIDDEEMNKRKRKKEKETRGMRKKRKNTNNRDDMNKRPKHKQEGEVTENTNRTITRNETEHVGNIKKGIG